MFEAISAFFASNPWLGKGLAGALAGFLAAVRIDFQVFATFKKVDEYASYDWSVAINRWVNGALYGFLSGVGLSTFA